MKSKTAIQQGAKYLYVKLGDIVTAVTQVAVVKGRPMWEVERSSGKGIMRRFIVPATALKPLPASL
jgi:hypothetical protein